MVKSGSWNVDFDLTLEGEDINFSDLNESSQEYILNCIKEGYFSGEIVEED